MGTILKSLVVSPLESQAPCPASFIHLMALSTGIMKREGLCLNELLTSFSSNWGTVSGSLTAN